MLPWRVFDVGSKVIPSSALPDLDITYEFKKRVIRSDRQEYYVEFKLKNTSSKKVEDFRVDIQFPLAFVNLSTIYGAEIRQRRTDTHMLLRNESPNILTGHRTILYPGDEVLLLSMDYFVTNDLFHKGALEQETVITIYSGDMQPIVKKVPMKDLSNF